MSLASLGKALGIGLALASLSAGSALAAYANTTVNVRSGPGTGYSVIGTLYSGRNVRITATEGDWCHVRKVGRDGWVLCNALDSGGNRYYGGNHYYGGSGYYRGYGGYGPYGGYGYGYPRLGFGLGLGFGGLYGGFGFGGGYGHYGHYHR